MTPMSPIGAWFSSLSIWNLMRLSVLTVFSASANASTMAAGASGFASVPMSGRPSRKPSPRFSVSSSSCDRFSTIRVMFPVSTDSSIDDVSTSVRLAESALEKSAFSATLPAMRSLIVLRSCFSNSAISAGRSPLSACRASRYSCCSSRMSDLLARSISSSPTRSIICANDIVRREIARSRQSCRILELSRGGK